MHFELDNLNVTINNEIIFCGSIFKIHSAINSKSRGTQSSGSDLIVILIKKSHFSFYHFLRQIQFECDMNMLNQIVFFMSELNDTRVL